MERIIIIAAIIIVPPIIGFILFKTCAWINRIKYDEPQEFKPNTEDDL
jgi:hypothetical protein